MGIATEYTMSVDDTKKAIILTGKEAIGTQLVQLLLLRPGTNMQYPDMGVDIRQYRFSTEEDLVQIKRAINGQISTYLPQYKGVPIDVTIDGNKLRIDFHISGVLYRYELTGEGNDRELADYAIKMTGGQD